MGSEMCIRDRRQRERIILAHYVRHMQRFYVDRAVRTSVVARDAPWDFTLETAVGERLHVEIVSIANDRTQFEQIKREERLSHWSRRKTIPLKDLEKLLRFFPNDKAKEELIQNPLKKKSPSNSGAFEN